MEKSIVHKTHRFYVLILLFCGLLADLSRAETFHLTNNQTVTGDIVSMDDKGIVMKLPDGSYADRLPWTKISQGDLKDLQQNPKAAQYVGPFIEPDPNEKLKRTEIDIKPVSHMPRLPKGSLIGAMFTSTMGLFTLLVLYAGNLYAAYEIALFRAQKPGLVCGVAAIAPVIGPIIFLAMPSNIKEKAPLDWTTAPTESLEPALAAAIEEEKIANAAKNADLAAEAAAAKPAAPVLPPTKTFARGQFTFNRRFFETQMPAFLTMTRPAAEADKILTFKSARGTFIVQRISRLSPNDLSLLVTKGAASEEIVLPFVEIQEITIKHQDA